jgi:hypothetical protein
MHLSYRKIVSETRRIRRSATGEIVARVVSRFRESKVSIDSGRKYLNGWRWLSFLPDALARAGSFWRWLVACFLGLAKPR